MILINELYHYNESLLWLPINFHLYNFAKYPDIQQRCYEEIQDVVANQKEINHETISEMHYLEACIQVTYSVHIMCLRGIFNIVVIKSRY